MGSMEVYRYFIHGSYWVWRYWVMDFCGVPMMNNGDIAKLPMLRLFVGVLDLDLNLKKLYIIILI